MLPWTSLKGLNLGFSHYYTPILHLACNAGGLPLGGAIGRDLSKGFQAPLFCGRRAPSSECCQATDVQKSFFD